MKFDFCIGHKMIFIKFLEFSSNIYDKLVGRLMHPLSPVMESLQVAGRLLAVSLLHWSHKQKFTIFFIQTKSYSVQTTVQMHRCTRNSNHDLTKLTPYIWRKTFRTSHSIFACDKKLTNNWGCFMIG